MQFVYQIFNHNALKTDMVYIERNLHNLSEIGI